MNAVIHLPSAADSLTFSQRQVLRSALNHGSLRVASAGGVQAFDAQGRAFLPRYPRRTINALERNGYLIRSKQEWQLTSDGRAVAGEG